MKIREFVEAAQKNKPEIFGKIPNARVAMLVKFVLDEAKKDLFEQKVENVKLPPLGTFVVKHVQVNTADGKQDRTRIFLHRPKR